VPVVLPHFLIGDILQSKPPQNTFLAGPKTAFESSGGENVDDPVQPASIAKIEVQDTMRFEACNAQTRFFEHFPSRAFLWGFVHLDLAANPVPLFSSEQAFRLLLQEKLSIYYDVAQRGDCGRLNHFLS